MSEDRIIRSLNCNASDGENKPEGKSKRWPPTKHQFKATGCIIPQVAYSRKPEPLDWAGRVDPGSRNSSALLWSVWGILCSRSALLFVVEFLGILAQKSHSTTLQLNQIGVPNDKCEQTTSFLPVFFYVTCYIIIILPAVSVSWIRHIQRLLLIYRHVQFLFRYFNLLFVMVCLYKLSKRDFWLNYNNGEITEHLGSHMLCLWEK